MNLCRLGPVIGAVAGFVLARFTDVPATVRRNDERIHNRDEDLRTWIEDDNAALEGDVRAKLEAATVAGVREGGAPVQIRDNVTSLYEQRYRDQLRDAERTVRDVHVSESAVHRLYRNVRRKPYPLLTTPRDLAPTLDRWRQRAPDRAA